MVHPDLNQSSPEVRAALIRGAAEVYGRVFAATIQDDGGIGTASFAADEAMKGFLDKLEHYGKE